MIKSQVANELYHLLTDYSNFIEFGRRQERTNYDFSKLDQLYVKQQEKKQPEQSIKTEIKKIITKQSLEQKDKTKKLVETAQAIIKCTRCELGTVCVQKVPGRGGAGSKVFIVSDYVNGHEQKTLKPLSGATGDFFKKWLDSIDMSLEEVFTTHIIKCNPAGKNIAINHIEACRSYLDYQIELIQPKIILALGQLTASSLKRSSFPLNTQHGKTFKYNNITVLPTFHPRDVLNNSPLKRAVWEDLKKLKQYAN